MEAIAKGDKVFILGAIKGNNSIVQTGEKKPLKELAKTLEKLGYKIYISEVGKNGKHKG